MNILSKTYARVSAVLRNQKTRLSMMGLNEYTNTPFFREYGVTIGEGCRIFSRSPYETFGSEPFLIKIGNYCAIAMGVRFITHDGGTWVFRRDDPDFDVFGTIEIKDNSFVGVNTLIMPGVTIGPNSVVGSGCVVSRDVPPNTVAVGVPAKPIMTLEEYREKKLLERQAVRGLSYEEREAILSPLWDK